MIKKQYKYSDITAKITGGAMEVHKIHKKHKDMTGKILLLLSVCTNLIHAIKFLSAQERQSEQFCK